MLLVMEQKKEQKKVLIANGCFYLGVLCELLVSVSGYAYGGYKEPWIIILGMLLFSVKILLTMHLRQDWPVFLGCAVFGLLCFCFQGSALVLRIALILLAGRDQQAKKVMKLFFFGTLAIMIITAVLSVLGLHNTMSLTQVFRNEPETRYCFGFFHPNGFSFFWMKVLALGFYCYYDRLKWWGYFISCSLGFGLFLLANSKTGIAGCILLMMGTIVIRYCHKTWVNQLIYYAGGILMASEIALVLITMYFFEAQPGTTAGVGIWNVFNILTTGRFYFIHKTAMEVPLPWFGYQGFMEATEVGFVNALYNQGILFFGIYLVILVWIYRKMYQKKDSMGMLLIVVFTFYSLGEAFLPYVNKNVVLMLCIGVIPALTLKRSKDKAVAEHE